MAIKKNEPRSLGNLQADLASFDTTLFIQEGKLAQKHREYEAQLGLVSKLRAEVANLKFQINKQK